MENTFVSFLQVMQKSNLIYKNEALLVCSQKTGHLLMMLDGYNIHSCYFSVTSSTHAWWYLGTTEKGGQIFYLFSIFVLSWGCKLNQWLILKKNTLLVLKSYIIIGLNFRHQAESWTEQLSLTQNTHQKIIAIKLQENYSR